MAQSDLNIRPQPDRELVDIADYVLDYPVTSREAYATARLCLMDTLGCGMAALAFPACTKLLGPLVAGTVVPQGARVPGTDYVLDPVKAAFDIGAMIRWLDFNDTWLAAEWGHPSDNLGGILAVADWLSNQAAAAGKTPPSVRSLLTAMIKAHEIQGVMALGNSFNRVGLDHVLLVRVATTAVTADLLGCDRGQIVNALSNAWIDGPALRTYRHAPNTGSRKSWAAGDASARGVTLALLAWKGEMGYPSALSAETWGFYDVFLKGRPFEFRQGYGSYVMENVLFKVSFPAEFHAQTAVEAGFKLHAQVQDRLEDIERVVIVTHEFGHAYYRQARAAEQPGRPGSLHPVHDRGRAYFWRADGGRLRGRSRCRSAHRCLAREDDRGGEQAVLARLPGTRKTLDRQCGSGVFQGRNGH